MLCLAAAPAFSQQLNLSLGPAFPVGAFGSKDGSDPASGLAKMGWMGDLSYMHSVGKKHFGVVAMIRGRLNGIDEGASIAPLQEQFSGYRWDVSSVSWKTAAILGGAYYQAPINEKWSFIGTLAVGVAEAWLPEVNVTGIMDSTAQGGDANIVVVNNKKAHGTTFTALAKAGIVYKLHGKFSLTASVDYWYLKPDFTLKQSVAFGQHMVVPGVYQLSNAASVSVYSVQAPYSQQMNTVNLSVGVAMHL